MKQTHFFALCIALVLCLPAFNNVNAQGIAVNNTGASANSSAMLDVASTTSGILIPRMTAAQCDAISTPSNGLLVYLTDSTPGFYYYTGTGWQEVGSGADGWTVNGTNIYAANGSGDSASGGYSTAMGAGSTAYGPYSTATGGSTANGNASSALGLSDANGTGATAMGDNTYAIGDYATATGFFSSAQGQAAIAMGYQALAYGDNATAIGLSATANAGSAAIGYLTVATGFGSTAMGYVTFSPGNYSTAMGSYTTASGDYTTALGNNVSTNNYAGSFIIGDSSTGALTNSTAANQMMMRFGGGYMLYTDDTLNTGVQFMPGGVAEYLTDVAGSYDARSLVDKNYVDSSLGAASGSGWTISGTNIYAANGSGTSASDAYSTAMGYNTSATAYASTAMGQNTTASGNNSTAMGESTLASGDVSTAIGGSATASGTASTAIGYDATASGNYSTGMGAYTTASGNWSTAMGFNVSTNNYAGSFIFGDSTASLPGDATNCTAANQMMMRFGGGYMLYTNNNLGTGLQLTSGGVANYLTDVASSYTARSLVDKNYVDSTLEVTGGGWAVSGTNIYASNGSGTIASGGYSTAMGNHNIASGEYSTAMGYGTTASGNYSTAMGYDVTASGIASTAMGYSVSTNSFSGSLIIGDGSTATITNCTAGNQMMTRFTGGYMLYSNEGLTSGVSLAAGGNSWSTISDRRKKENFAAVNGEDFLKKIDGFALTSWNYKGQDAKIFRHYGPMAQDFYAAFGKDSYGTIGNDTTIGQADFEGVSFIAIQALEKRTKEQAEEIKELKAENAVLKAQSEKVVDLSKRLEAVEASISGNEKVSVR